VGLRSKKDSIEKKTGIRAEAGENDEEIIH
jgi:hypothetical protein